MPHRTTHIQRLCYRLCLNLIHAKKKLVNELFYLATYRAQLIHHRAAFSIRAAGKRPRSVAPMYQSYSKLVVRK